MSAREVFNFRLKAAVSVSEMAKMVKLSRARFYDLVERGVFLYPVYSLANKRPFYTAEMQQENLDARQTCIGCNDEYIIFYDRWPNGPAPKRQPSVSAPVRQDHGQLIAGLKSLGLTSVTNAQVEEAVATNYPNGTTGVDESMVLRTIYRHFRRLGTA
jgi:hypothetical protein